MLLYLRSILFNAAFYICTLVQMIVYTPFYFLLPRKKAWIVPKLWARVNLKLQKIIAGTDYVIEGLDNIPEGAYICAPKHQSAWDTYAFLPYLDDPVLILKRELMRIPLFGWYVAKMEMIPVDRGSRVKALHSITKGAEKAIAEGRQILIYPEGTRRAPGAPPQYKYGIVHLYDALNLPVLPIAHNAGLYWPRRKFLRFPGTIRCRVLPPIPPGLEKEEFLRRLIETTETACDELLVAASRDPNPPPMPPTAVDRLKELGVSPRK
ncbi:lysophospholipid acyltransferase family protein [Ochrobactrum soli]|uniref:1-acyl-sn-glycerol-3-phosphate acyltransferase n=1 Tax=Ochrobactrum soli TaxID=2448455 RepID=A0A849KD66_9HYPH|nr:1-acyl-sn-glycerol-3-phosphate acyltransferase [[Ochrobactrum] soli]NNU59371.1 1-acyl-sn-glycerol-3-phosphate acyltransferase [[Ochrobactrum] soli]